jgi:hypothetical protein
MRFYPSVGGSTNAGYNLPHLLTSEITSRRKKRSSLHKDKYFHLAIWVQ